MSSTDQDYSDHHLHECLECNDLYRHNNLIDKGYKCKEFFKFGYCKKHDQDHDQDHEKKK